MAEKKWSPEPSHPVLPRALAIIVLLEDLGYDVDKYVSTNADPEQVWVELRFSEEASATFVAGPSNFEPQVMADTIAAYYNSWNALTDGERTAAQSALPLADMCPVVSSGLLVSGFQAEASSALQ